MSQDAVQQANSVEFYTLVSVGEKLAEAESGISNLVANILQLNEVNSVETDAQRLHRNIQASQRLIGTDDYQNKQTTANFNHLQQILGFFSIKNYSKY